jgi:hypothetical protein
MRILVITLVALAYPATAWADGVWSQDVPLHARAPASTRAVRTFDLVGLHWQGSGRVLFRTRSVAGRWSAWHGAAPEAEDQPDPGSAERAARPGWKLGNPYWTGASNRIEYRLVGRVRRLRAWFVEASATSTPLRQVALAGAPPLIPRSAWRADEAIVRAKPRYAPRLRLAIVHHTAGASTYAPTASARIVRAIELYHVKGNGWNDIGYNFLVDRYGQVFEGRGGGIARNVIGAHAEGFNTGSVGVAVIGNFAARSITPAAKAALVKLIAWRLDVAHVDPLARPTVASGGNPKFRSGMPVSLRAISGHRDAGFTSCPGNVLYNVLPSIADEVARTGLPKLYDPVVRGGVGGPASFSARLSAPAAWRVSVRDASGIIVAMGTGVGQAVAWTWDATLVPRGAYRWTIEAGAATRPAAGRIGTGTLTSPPPPPADPVTDLSVEPPLISPNGDGFADAATVSYVVKTKAAVSALVRNAEAFVVSTLFTEQQQSAKRQSFLWTADGLPDGLYVFEVSARTADGRRALLEDDVVVDRTLSAVTVTPPVVSPNGDGRDDAAAISFTLAAPTPVTVQVEQAGQVVAVPFSGLLEAGTQQVTWDGNAPDGTYDAVVIAQTPLAAVRQTVPVTVNRAA